MTPEERAQAFLDDFDVRDYAPQYVTALADMIREAVRDALVANPDVEPFPPDAQAQLPTPDDPTPPDGGMENPTITFSNPSYREWLLHQAAEADTPEERERFLALANGQQVALGDRQTAVLTATKKVGK